MSVQSRLAQLGIELPEPAAPVASYVPVVVHGGFAYVSGQVSFSHGRLITGQLGRDLVLEDGIAAARACGLMILAQINAALGTLDRVERVIRLGAFVNCTADFTDHPKVANGASDLMVEVFGEIGQHSRAAVGAPSLPLDAAVEIDAIFAVTQD